MSENIKEKIIDFLNIDQFLSFSSLLLKLESNEEELEIALNELENDNIIHQGKKGKYGLLSSYHWYIGEIRLKKQGYGFFKCDELEEDVYISIYNLDNAIDGDTVIAWVDTYSNEGRHLEGKVVKVLKHNSNLVCHVIYGGKLQSEMYPDLKIIPMNHFDDLKQDDLVLVKVLETDLISKMSIKVEILSKIGNNSDLRMDIKKLCYSYGVSQEFGEDINQEILNINKNYLDNINSERERRKYIDKLIITIDGEDAKDLDDAVSVMKLDNGNYLLGVYIADVSYFVRENSLVDKEALNRGTSIYLIDQVIPMLPNKLCNDLCSLNPSSEKYVLACEMEIDKNGKVVDNNIYEGIIKTRHRMTYTNINRIIDKDYAGLDEYKDIFSMVKDMVDLSNILNIMRIKRGSLDFDIPESIIDVDENGKPIDVKLKERKQGEKLIEEFMLIANETVAERVSSLGLPFIYRVHDEPPALKLEKLKKAIKNSPYTLKKTSRKVTQFNIQTLLNDINKNDSFLSVMLLRMMAKAKYSENNIGHFGLASNCYTHFTSPIRRYPDLLVHRLVKKYIINSNDFYKNYNTDEEIVLFNNISRIAKISSEREINANNLEYAVIDMKKAEYMEGHIGDKYNGTISSVLSFGFFVTLSNGIDGLVHIKTLTDDYYEFIDDVIIGKRKHKKYKMGDKVIIEVVDANKEDSTIDFKLYRKQ